MNKRINLSIVALLCLSFSGCHLLHKEEDVPRDWLGREVEIAYTVPSKVVAIWTNSVFNKMGEAPKRGLGGRVYFYNDDHQPVRVDGGLSVYVYDDTDAKPNSKLKQEASRVVHFDAEEVKANFSPTEFGASYSFWVPWDNVGGDRKQLSIIPVFTDSTGHMIVGEQARQLLPGKEPVEITDEYGNAIVQASHTTSYSERVKVSNDSGPRQSGDRSSPKRVTSEKIRLPESMQKRLSQPKPQHKSWDIQEWSKFDNSRIRSSIPQGDTIRQAHAETGQASNQFKVTQAQAITSTKNAAAQKTVKPLGALRDDASREQAISQVPEMTAENVKQFLKKPMPATETVKTNLRPQPSRRTSMYSSQSNRSLLSSRQPLLEK